MKVTGGGSRTARSQAGRGVALGCSAAAGSSLGETMGAPFGLALVASLASASAPGTAGRERDHRPIVDGCFKAG